ncbi:MAG: hypothetical protein P8164_04035 [Gammaproteobacteria bacterium]
MIDQYGATDFCGHEHNCHVSRPWKDNGGKAWQVPLRSGGSPFEAPACDATVKPKTDRDYARATAGIHRRGKVETTIYGFNAQYGPILVLQTDTSGIGRPSSSIVTYINRANYSRAIVVLPTWIMWRLSLPDEKRHRLGSRSQLKNCAAFVFDPFTEVAQHWRARYSSTGL